VVPSDRAIDVRNKEDDVIEGFDVQHVANPKVATACAVRRRRDDADDSVSRFRRSPSGT